jgi:hypothetical protein
MPVSVRRNCTPTVLFGGGKLHVDMSATTTVALPTKIMLMLTRLRTLPLLLAAAQ